MTKQDPRQYQRKHQHQSGKTHFGYQQVNFSEKANKVRQVFDSVANKYDVMNDLMSAGSHRFWKYFALELCQLRAGHVVLDLAGGTGDMSARMAPKLGDDGHIIIADINAAMLNAGRDRLLNQGLYNNIDYVLADAEALPFKDSQFDCICIAFGLRNVTHIDKALQSMYSVLKPGGRTVILEFSKLVLPFLRPIYDAYSFSILPQLGRFIVGDAESYRYLAESIRMHPDQETLKKMMSDAGFDQCDYYNLTGGVVAAHVGYKF